MSLPAGQQVLHAVGADGHQLLEVAAPLTRRFIRVSFRALGSPGPPPGPGSKGSAFGADPWLDPDQRGAVGLTDTIRLVRNFTTEAGTVEDFGFVATDLAKALEVQRTSNLTDRLDPDQKGAAQIGTLGGIQSLTVVSESGFYDVVVRSDKPAAKPLRNLVTRQILPALRKTGTYSVGPAKPPRLTLDQKGRDRISTPGGTTTGQRSQDLTQLRKVFPTRRMAEIPAGLIPCAASCSSILGRFPGHHLTNPARCCTQTTAQPSPQRSPPSSLVPTPDTPSPQTHPKPPRPALASLIACGSHGSCPALPQPV